MEVTYLSNRELREIGRETMTGLEDRDPIFEHFPIESSDSDLLEWRQKDDWNGLQQLRGVNGAPLSVQRKGERGYLMLPGNYGEFTTIDEKQRQEAARSYRGDGPLDVTALIREDQDYLISREWNRIRKILWDLAVTGSFSVTNGFGHQAYIGQYVVQSYTPPVSWNSRNTAEILADFEAISTMGRGHGVAFNQMAKMYMNQETFNDVIGNRNPNDLWGLRTGGGDTASSSVENVMKILKDRNHPQIQVHEGHFRDDANNVTMLIPANKAVIFGYREDGAQTGNYRMTRNINNDNNAPGGYDYVHEEKRPPRLIEVHRGHNGGPVLYYPSSILVINL